MRINISLIWLSLVASAYGNEKILLTKAEAEQVFTKASAVVVLHWSEEAQDYLVERLKGNITFDSLAPSEIRLNGSDAAIKKEPEIVFIFIHRAPPPLHSNPTVLQYCIPTNSDHPDHLGVAEVLAILRKNKHLERKANEPNKAMEPTPVSVTISAAQKVAPLTSVAHLRR